VAIVSFHAQVSIECLDVGSDHHCCTSFMTLFSDAQKATNHGGARVNLEWRDHNSSSECSSSCTHSPLLVCHHLTFQCHCHLRDVTAWPPRVILTWAGACPPGGRSSGTGGRSRRVAAPGGGSTPCKLGYVLPGSQPAFGWSGRVRPLHWLQKKRGRTWLGPCSPSVVSYGGKIFGSSAARPTAPCTTQAPCSPATSPTTTALSARHPAHAFFCFFGMFKS